MLNFLSRARLTRGTALAILLAVSSAHADLVGYWNLNEGTGTTANDLSANRNHGTLTAVAGGAVPTWTVSGGGRTGLPGDYALNTSVQGCVNVPDSASLHITNSWTLAAWVWDNSSNYGHVFSASSAHNSRKWLLQTSGYGGGSNYFWSDTGNTGFNKSLGYITPLGAWRHLAVTYDGANLRTYGDGVLKTTIAQTGSLAAWDTLHLGAAANNSGALGSAVNGLIDELAIFNTVENVTSIMNGTHPAMLPLPVWTGGGTPNGSGQRVWSDAANWGGTALAASNPLTFAAAAAPGATTNFNSFAANTQFTGITFNAGTAAFTLSGNAVNQCRQPNR